MLFDPDKLDDNDPRKIAFLKQQEDQRQRAQKQPADQENSDKVRPNPNLLYVLVRGLSFQFHRTCYVIHQKISDKESTPTSNVDILTRNTS